MDSMVLGLFLFFVGGGVKIENAAANSSLVMESLSLCRQDTEVSLR